MQHRVNSKLNISRNKKFNLTPQNLLSLKLKTRNINNSTNTFQIQTNPNKTITNNTKSHKHSSSFQTNTSSLLKKKPSLNLNRPFHEIKLITLQSHYNSNLYNKAYNRSHTPTLSKKSGNCLQVSKDELHIIKSLKNEMKILNEKNWKLQKELNALKLNKFNYQYEHNSNNNINGNDIVYCKSCNELQNQLQLLKDEMESIKLLQFKEESQFNKRIVNLTKIISQQKNEIAYLSKQQTYMNNIHITQEISFEIQANKSFSFPEMLTETQISKITFLLIKTFFANEETPIETISSIFQKINDNYNIESFTHELNSKYNLNNIPLINSYVYSLGLTKNKSFSFKKFKEKTLAIFNNSQLNQISFNNNFNINSEIKMNCISDIVALCIKFDPNYQGYIHFELFTNIIMNYINNDIITKKGFEYLVYVMKKCSADNYGNDLFMVYYRGLISVISQINKCDNNINNSKYKMEQSKESSNINEEEINEWNGGSFIKMIPLEENNENEEDV